MTWSLAYAHDEDGQPTEGQRERLIEAVVSGHSVRFLLFLDDYQYVTDAQCLWVWRENVYAQNTSHLSMDFFQKSQGELRPVFPNAHADDESVDPDGEFVLRFQDRSYWWMLLADTQANLDMNRYLIGTHVSNGHSQTRAAMKWFVNGG